MVLSNNEKLYTITNEQISISPSLSPLQGNKFAKNYPHKPVKVKLFDIGGIDESNMLKISNLSLLKMRNQNKNSSNHVNEE